MESFRGLFGPQKLLNKYAAIISESRDIRAGDVDKLLQMWKAITGGDTINVARKYQDAVDARLFCRLMYIANEFLPFDDSSQAMFDRTLLLYFPNNYRQSGPDRLLPSKLMGEAPGIALWAIKRLRRLLEQDQFTLPESSKEYLASVQSLTNPIGLMLNECCTYHVGPMYFTHAAKCNDLYDLWVAWCKATNTRNNLSRIGFGMKLHNLPHPLKRKQRAENGVRFYVYEGLEIVKEAMANYLGK
jgi:phage/plasmid-associated DNA primase